MTKQTVSKWYSNTTRVIVLAFVMVGFFAGFRSVVHGDPVITSAIGLALVYLTSKELI